jgi:hypothetical protein
MMTLLLVSLLVFGNGLVSLVFAISYAEDGYENDSGFHRDPHSSAEARQWQAIEVTPWDQVEGASCPLNLTR